MNSFSREDFILMISEAGSIKNKNFTGIDLSGLAISNLKFDNCIFDDASFKETELISVYFKSCSFKRCKFISSTLEDVYFFSHCTLDGSIVENSYFEHLVSHLSIASGIKVVDSEFRNSTFIHASHQGSFLKNVKFNKCFFQMVFLCSSELDNIKISNSVIENIDINGSEIKNDFLIESCLYTGFDVKVFRSMGIKIKKIYKE
ncbi:pentapeptide repeat-containing protein [Patescibacteria group bacterium]|nr:pentapeptide repeat-containing protein [Patescibacteria group bacterium]